MSTAKKKEPVPHRPPKKNTRTRVVEAYACGQCNVVHKKHESADACCRCRKCNTKCAEYSTWAKLCGHCNHRKALIAAKKRVQSMRESLALAERQLAYALNNRPAKGSAYK